MKLVCDLVGNTVCICEVLANLSDAWEKFRSIRRKKRKPPTRRPKSPERASTPAVPPLSTPAPPNSPSRASGSSSSQPGPSTAVPTRTESSSSSSQPGPSTAVPTRTESSSSSSQPGPSSAVLTKSVMAMERKIGKKRAREENELEESDFELCGEFEGKGCRILEVEGLQAAATELRCKCRGKVLFKESLEEKQGLYIYLFLLLLYKVQKAYSNSLLQTRALIFY